MESLRLSHVVFSDADDNLRISSIPKDNEEKLYRSTSILVTAGKEEPHTSSSFQLYSLVVALVTLVLGPPSAKSTVAAASYFLLGSRHYGSILSGFLRVISFSSAAVRLELGLAKVSLRSLVDRSQLLLCLDSLGLVMTVVTTWMIPQFILAWAAIRRHADAHSIVMEEAADSSSLAILGIAFLSFSSIILEGYILRYSVHTQETIEKTQISLTE
eukprot:CAMPEP_0113639708 /NCGR_PEP_ID=MMETSP0017_2-20120614/20837_1 /TAXON_ID=2856 /ORGANISM="Cylindrotheca closterium" /LENGTH=214 /DNA_ID=CAMNT_0000550947 /DNA_START=42 /DNA_END=686 /DNA_ORIENTATION=+ /assembly_acc=CAM_ASM_000147